MEIYNANVFGPDGQFHTGSVRFGAAFGHDGGGERLDAQGGYVIPGLVDIHLHGAMNADFCDGDAAGLKRIGQFLITRGVTSFCATTMTFDEPTLTQALRAVRDYGAQDTARCVGVNLEGPFISRAKKGAQNGAFLQPPDAALLARLNEASGGLVRLVDMAPELDGAMEFISQARKSCRVSLAHTACDYETAMAAFSAGADHVTHLYNAMAPLEHRSPGVIGAAADAGAFVELICDGLHIHPSVIRATFKLFGADRVCLISDSMRCAGLPDGDYELGGQPVFVRQGRAALADGTLAGSSINLLTAVQRAVSFGISLEQAVLAATVTPAQAIGLADEIGTIAPGRRADCVLLGCDLEPQAVFLGGIRCA